MTCPTVGREGALLLPKHRKDYAMTEVDTIVFLDLEQTIIASFDDPFLINVQSIKQFLQDRNVTEVGIYSFAIWDQKDQHTFETHIKPTIELALGITVKTWPTLQDFVRADREYTGIRFDPEFETHEFIQLRGKKDGFLHYVQHKYNFKKAILIDDVVPNLTIIDRDRDRTIELWNVDRLEYGIMPHPGEPARRLLNANELFDSVMGCQSFLCQHTVSRMGSV